MSRVRRRNIGHHLIPDEDDLKKIALFGKIDRRRIAAHDGEYSKIHKQWKEEQAATKKPKVDYLNYKFSSSDSDSESSHKRPPLISQKGLKLLSSNDESDDLKTSSSLPSHNSYIDCWKRGNPDISINSDSS